MFDNNVFIPGSCVNVLENGAVTGFELQTNITYYRGIPLSMVEYVRVAVDGRALAPGDLRISVDREDWFTLREAETVTTYKWEYGEPLYIRALEPGGLPRGTHRVTLTVATRTAYIPIPLEGVKEREVIIE